MSPWLLIMFRSLLSKVETAPLMRWLVATYSDSLKPLGETPAGSWDLQRFGAMGSSVFGATSSDVTSAGSV